MGSVDLDLAMQSLCLAVLCAVLCAWQASAVPTLSTQATINLGTPMTVTYAVTDGIDGRTVTKASQGAQGTGKYLSTTGNDWVGLYKKGGCKSPTNNQDRHKCYLHWWYVPAESSSGTLTFYQEHYKTAGEYELRYFYGDNPTIPGTYSWIGQGWVCDTWTDTNPLITGSQDLGNTFHANAGKEGTTQVAGLTLAQCQCNPTTGDAATQATCKGYRAACGRCALDAVATSNTITVVGAGTSQDMKSLPGFEIGFGGSS